MAVTQDGYYAIAGGGNVSTPNCAAPGLSTTNSNDIILYAVFSEWDGHASGPGQLTSVTSPNTTGWTRRASIQSTLQGHGNGATLDLWWGKAAAPLTNEIITSVLSAECDDVAIIAIGFSGVNQTTPFDTNVSLTASAKNDGGGSSTPSVSSASTSANNTAMITFAGAGSNNDFTSSSKPSGWTAMGTPVTTNNGNLAAEMIGALQIETAAQSGLTVTFASSVGGVGPAGSWIALVDALQAASQAIVTKSSAALIGF